MAKKKCTICGRYLEITDRGVNFYICFECAKKFAEGDEETRKKLEKIIKGLKAFFKALSEE